MATQPTTSTVWSQLSDDLRRFIRRRVADDHIAEDLLQETFVRIHENIGRLADAERVAAWVYQIARNVIYGHYRKRGDGAAALGDTEPAGPTEDVRDLVRARAGIWMDELIRQLPEPYREAVQLAEIDDLTQQDVADRLGLSLSGAKSRIQRGRAMLKDVLDECCRWEFDRRGNLTGCDPNPDRAVCRNCDELD
jgi:RNA polymerase sigma-70 factor (ECF subfamily)